VAGDGRLVRIMGAGIAGGIRRPWSPGLAAVVGASGSVLDLAVASDGARSVGENRSVRGITVDGVISAM